MISFGWAPCYFTYFYGGDGGMMGVLSDYCTQCRRLRCSIASAEKSKVLMSHALVLQWDGAGAVVCSLLTEQRSACHIVG